MKARILQAAYRIDGRTKTAIFFICGVIIFFFMTAKPAPQTTDRRLIKNIYPTSVRQVYPNPNHNDSVLNMICITINIPLSWKVGETFDGMKQNTNNTLLLKLDGTPVARTPDRVFIARGFASSKNGGEYPISICEPAHLTTGQHQISASWLPNDGKSYAYKWTFDTDAVASVEMGDRNINLLVQYDIWREQVIDN